MSTTKNLFSNPIWAQPSFIMRSYGSKRSKFNHFMLGPNRPLRSKTDQERSNMIQKAVLRITSQDHQGCWITIASVLIASVTIDSVTIASVTIASFTIDSVTITSVLIVVALYFHRVKIADSWSLVDDRMATIAWS